MLQKNEGGGHFAQKLLVIHTHIIWNIKMLQKMGGGTSYKIHNLFIERYYLRYKTHWFTFILEDRF